MVQIVHRRFSEFGENKSSITALQRMLSQTVAEDRDDDHDFRKLESARAEDIRPSYVPFMDVPRPAKIPGIVSIVESKTRVYLRPHHQHASTALSTEDFDDEDATPSSSHQRTAFARNGELDLGMEPLQTIVYKMRRLQTEAQRTVVDRHAAKRAGMLQYCSFLVGNNPAPKPRRPRTAIDTVKRPFK